MPLLRAFVLVACAAIGACALYDDTVYSEPTPLALTIARTNLLADAASVTSIVVTIPRGLGSETQLKLVASDGQWVESGNGELTTTLAGETTVTAYLRAPLEPGLQTIVANVGNTTITDTLRYSPAPPEAIVLIPDKFTIEGGIDAAVTLTVSLTRAVGRVSPHLVVAVQALDSQNADRCGCTGALPTDSSGATSFKFFPGVVSSPTVFDIGVSVPGGVSGPTAHVRINVVPPTT